MKHHRVVPRVLALALSLVLALSMSPAAGAAKPQAHPSTNIMAQQYDYWAKPVNSYLYENEGGGLTRVEHIVNYSGGSILETVVVEDYDSGFVLQSGRTIPMELPLWGGFFAGADYNFVIFGQENKEQDDRKEVVRVVKYGKNWERLGAASLYGANTTVPFDAGSVRCDEYGGWLYIRTSHEMYTTPDGLNHQANMMLAIRQGDMAVTDSFYQVETDVGYVSHSFNQFILVDAQGRIVALDHGDGYPRGLLLQRYVAKAGQESFRTDEVIWTDHGDGWMTGISHPTDNAELAVFPGPIGANNTGCSVGGLAETSKGYVAAYSYDGVGRVYDPRSVYLAFIGEDLAVKTIQLTAGVNATTPQVAAVTPERGYVMWNQRVTKINQMGYGYTEWGDTLHYVVYAADGTRSGVRTAANAPLSDCAPIAYGGKAVWYVTDGGAPTFYALDDLGVQVMVSDAAKRFTDMKAGAYYLDPVAWAVNKGITTGTGDGSTFSPGKPCTHGEILTFLWRAAGRPDSSAQAPIDLEGDEYYAGAVEWAAEKGMIGAGFDPGAACTRAYAMLYIWQAFGSPAPAGANPFTDMPAYASSTPATVWAMERGVTTGTSSTTFSPNTVCSRGEIVTFLCRAYR